LIHLKDGKPVKIEGNPDSPVNRGTLCIKGLASLDYLDHPDRLKYPLKREGDRGQGRWKKISWDEALDTIAGEMAKAKKDFGPESVVMVMGYAKGFQNTWLHRLANVFGTPNVAGMGHLCTQPRSFASKLTLGFSPTPDFDHPPGCVVVWGVNSAETNHPLSQKMLNVLRKGTTKLIVIDPKDIDLTKKADQWLKVRPGSDLALALGMIHVIINEGLYDKAFVDKWTSGFEALREHVQNFSPEKVEPTTWIEAKAIRDAARVYSQNRPACILWGNAIDHNLNSFQTARAISILRAITGNLGVPGGEAEWATLPLAWWASPDLELRDRLPKENWRKRVGADLKLLPMFHYILPQRMIKAILEGDPYPIQTVFVQGCNSLVTYSHAQETYRALKKLRFLAVADLFMTPTAALADIVLPVGSYLEFDSLVAPTNVIAQVQQRVAQVGECKSDYEIMSELARRLELGEHFWDTTEQALDAILKPAGLTFEEFRQIGILSSSKQYRRYEQNGFGTPSGKVELYSSQLKEWGFDPLPVYHELPETPYSDPSLVKEYPLILTSCKSSSYQHSAGRQISTLRQRHPEPTVIIHTELAEKMGIREGDWVYIETKRGRIKQKARLTSAIDPGVVVADYGWWFPERGVDDIYGWSESNVNLLTDNKPPYNREIGSPTLRGILCKVYKA
jgi:anaerobic selenocysteine-containing dehydrogenase